MSDNELVRIYDEAETVRKRLEYLGGAIQDAQNNTAYTSDDELDFIFAEMSDCMIEAERLACLLDGLEVAK
jgi:signal transduction histidine kinase